MVEAGAQQQHDIRVRTATVEDADILLDYACTMAFETENKTLDRSIVRPAIVKCIENPKLGYYLVAWDESDQDKKTVGCLMITFEVSFQQGGRIDWIQSVYVAPEARRKGVFRKLYNAVIERARAEPEVKCVRLYVETENVNAQAVYERMGMTKMDTYEFNE